MCKQLTCNRSWERNFHFKSVSAWEMAVVSRCGEVKSEFNLHTCFALFITFVLQAFCTGQMLTVYEYYLPLLDYFGDSRSATAWVGAVNMAIAQCTGAFGFLILPRLGYRRCIWLGTVVGTFGLVTSYIANTILHLIFTYGIIFGVGTSLVLLGTFDAVRANFTKYLYIAMSISLGGGGFGMMIVSPLVSNLIEDYGWRGAFLLQAGFNLQMAVLGSMLVPKKKKVDGLQKGVKLKPMSLKKRCVEMRLWILSIASFIIAGSLITFYVIFKDLANLSLLSDYIPAAVQALGAGNIIGRISAGPLAMVISPLNILLGNKFLVATIPFLYLATANGPGFVSLAALVGLAHGIEAASQAHGVVHLFGAAELAPSLGYVLSFAGLGTIIMPPISGFLVDKTGDYGASLLMSGSCGIIAIGLIIALLLSHKRHLRLQAAEDVTIKINEVAAESVPFTESNDPS